MTSRPRVPSQKTADEAPRQVTESSVEWTPVQPGWEASQNVVLGQQMARSLIAGVGQRFWRDLSAGPVWLDRIETLKWPDHVTLDDYSSGGSQPFGVAAMAKRLQEQCYERLVFLTATSRGRAPASLHLKRYEPRQTLPLSGEGELGELQASERVQVQIPEGGGMISIETLLDAAEQFEALPPVTWILEIEPLDTGWGNGLSAEVESLYPRALSLLRSFAKGESLQPMDLEHGDA